MAETRICPKCQTPNAVENQFCQFCGDHLPQTTISYPPPPASFPPPSRPAAQQTSFFATRVDRLGTLRDKWNAVLIGAADKAEEVTTALDAELEEHQMPQVNLGREILTTGGVMGKRRLYYLNRARSGATVAVYIGPFGEDLYLTWELFIRLAIKWGNLVIMVGIAFLLAIFWSMDGGSFIGFVLSLMGLIPFVLVCAMILGKVLRGNKWAFIIEVIDHFTRDDIIALVTIVDYALRKAVDEVGLNASLLPQKEEFGVQRRVRLI